MNTGIYAIQNTVTGKRYIGGSRNFANRWRQHRQSLDRGDHHSATLQQDWRAHGAHAFVFKPVIICGLNNLLMYEQTAMDHYKPEYNSAPTAGSQRGFKMSAESRSKLAEAARRTRNFTGKTHTAETKAKISAKKTGSKMGPYSAERVSKTAEAMRAAKSKLSEELVREGRRLRQEGATIQQVADGVGCTFAAAYDFLRGRTYGWVV